MSDTVNVNDEPIAPPVVGRFKCFVVMIIESV